MSSRWEEVKARKRDQEIRRLALELDPIIWVSYAYEQDETLSQLVDREGWEGALEFPEVRRFLDRLGAMVADRNSERAYLLALLDKGVRYHAENMRRAEARIEKALALHTADYADLCEVCEYRWPCPTVVSLTGQEEK